MKFGRNLSRNQVPEWSSSYINYKGLKKLIKNATAVTKTGTEPDLAEFFYSLDRNLEDVDNFYNKRFSESARRLKLLEDRYGRIIAVELDHEEIEELMGALLELRGQLRKLQWFGEVNRRGFMKITKKLDKKVPGAESQQAYVVSKVDPRPFAYNALLNKAMNRVNEWLSTLGDNARSPTADDARSLHSVHSISRTSSSAHINLSPELLATLETAIRNDAATILHQSLRAAEVDARDPGIQKLQIKLLHRAISCKAESCIELLLKQVDSLFEEDDINQRNCLHRLVISVGRSKLRKKNDPEKGLVPFPDTEESRFIMPASHPISAPKRSTDPEGVMLASDAPVQFLEFVLKRIRPCQQIALMARDSYGRIPLHYGAQYGIVVVCELLVKFMHRWAQFDVQNGIDSLEWQDNEGLTPLHLSVMGGHPLTTEALLVAEKQHSIGGKYHAPRRRVSTSGAVLALATKSNLVPIVQLLVQAGVNVNWKDGTGETSLHIAARFGYDECARTLIYGPDDQRVDVDVPENSFSWTPLHIAAVDGHLSMVELLLGAGADANRADVSGWIAKEHAALRGHIAIAERLALELPELSNDSASDSGISVEPSSPPRNASLSNRCSQPDSDGIRPLQQVKTFGHRYLTDKTMILVTLGSMDMRKEAKAVELDKIPMAEAHLTQLDTALSLIVHATGAEGEDDSTIIDLPVHENISTDPIAFTTHDPSKVKLLFDLVPTYSGNEKHKIGRGVALLNTIKHTIGTKRMNLQGDVSAPIIGSNLEVLGIVNFNFIVVTPFSHPKMGINEKQTYWKSLSSTMVIGHRGLGKNATSNKSLQLGENTIPSFIAAANLGANYVEFDVQLTKDHVPVIYHDFLVSETGIDAPVHMLTLEQFMHINRSKNSSRVASPDREKSHPSLDRLRNGEPRQRSFSVGHLDIPEAGLDERMKHTRDYKSKGYKANTRGKFIQAPFTTLEEMFNQIPENVGFNIEMKYPMLFESEEHEMDTYAVELNSFCDTILTKVYDMANTRNIIFSSFNPDICLLLSLKQPSMPILFLTDAGTCAVSDIRASSLQEAIRFASRWNLLGIVSSAEPLCNSPRLVRVVKENGLVCVSYGELNNDPVKVQQQVQEGIDAVIVDNVLAIRKGLTEHAASMSKHAADVSRATEMLKEVGLQAGSPIDGGDELGEQQVTVLVEPIVQGSALTNGVVNGSVAV